MPFTVALFCVSIVAQLAGITYLPRTDGFTKPIPTIICSTLFLIAIYAFANITKRGVEIGILFPIMAAVIPLVSIVIGIVVYGEGTSIIKLSLLTTASVLIGFAAKFS